MSRDFPPTRSPRQQSGKIADIRHILQPGYHFNGCAGAPAGPAGIIGAAQELLGGLKISMFGIGAKDLETLKNSNFLKKKIN